MLRTYREHSKFKKLGNGLREIVMPASLPYLASNKNIGELFTKIASAAIPPEIHSGVFADNYWLERHQ
jgi:hypothetical protein